MYLFILGLGHRGYSSHAIGTPFKLHCAHVVACRRWLRVNGVYAWVLLVGLIGDTFERLLQRLPVLMAGPRNCSLCNAVLRFLSSFSWVAFGCH